MGKKAKNATYISGNEAGKISREVAKVEKRRTVKSTLCNERSSRSHCMVGCNEQLALFTLIFMNDPTVYDFAFLSLLQIILDVPSVGGRLMLVDMAGSENIEAAGQTGFDAKMQVCDVTNPYNFSRIQFISVALSKMMCHR